MNKIFTIFTRLLVSYFLVLLFNTGCIGDIGILGINSPATTSPPSDSPSPSTGSIALNVIPYDTRIILSWTNPSLAASPDGVNNITGIDILQYIFINRTLPSLVDTIQVAMANLGFGGQPQAFTVTNLTINTTYSFEMVFHYDNNASLISPPINITTGPNLDGDDKIDRDDPDKDGDGILDGPDNCPLVNNTDQSDLDNDTRGDACDDNDADGLLDISDSCWNGLSNWTSDGSTDMDADGCRDTDEDIDDDNDGLIEIYNATMFNAMRNVLDGSGLAFDANASDFSSQGCRPPACDGYELMTNISLVDYIENEGWQPIGGCEEEPFTARFDGNHHTITNLTIDRSGEFCTGLFAFIQSPGSVTNLQFIQPQITSDQNLVGVLAGRADTSPIINISVLSASVTGAEAVGGLIGQSREAELIAIRIDGLTIDAPIRVGGLVGHALTILNSNQVDLTISSSYAVNVSIKGNQHLGGLVGQAASQAPSNEALIIENSYAEVDSIVATGNNIGGLVGQSIGAKIDYSYAVIDMISGGRWVGGLVGSGERTMVDACAVIVTGSLSGTEDGIGGLLGDGTNADVTSASVIAKRIASTMNRVAGGLIGSGPNAIVHGSHVIVEEIGTHSSMDETAGGIIAYGPASSVSDSYAIINSIRTSKTGQQVAALIGYGGTQSNQPAEVTNSYAVFSNSINELIGGGSTGPPVTNSYWDVDIGGMPRDDDDNDRPTVELQSPQGYETIYEDWDDTPCDNVTNRPTNSIWDFGSTTEYPVHGCTLDSPTQQRSWWSINSGSPEINASILDNIRFPIF